MPAATADPDDWDGGERDPVGGDLGAAAAAARFEADLAAGLEAPPEGAGWQGAWFSLAETDDPALLDPAAFTQGGAAERLAPDAVLAAVAQAACDPGVLSAATDNVLLGLVAGSRRLAARAAAIQLSAIAEYAGRHTETDRKKASRMGFTWFAADDLAPELVVTATSAEVHMSQALAVTGRLPKTAQALWDGLVSDYQVKIIAEATMYLSGAGAAEADAILAQAAPGLTPGQLRAMAARVVMMIDPQAAEEQHKHAARNARVEKYREWGGTAALCGRDLPPDAVLRSWQHIDGRARALRRQGAAGTLEQLRAAVYLGLTAAMDPLAMLERIRAAAAGQDGTPDDPAARNGTAPAGTGEPWPPDEPGAGDDGDADGHTRPVDEETGGQPWPWDEPDEADNGHDDGEDDGPAGGTRPGHPDHPGPGPQPGPRPGPGNGAPFPAVINLLVPAGTAFGWSSAPGEIPGFGPLDPRTTRDMMQAASHHPGTRWCLTLIGPDGTAAAHGCAPGRHPWTPPTHTGNPNRYRTGGGERDGPELPRDRDPGPGTTARQQAAAAEFIAGLRAKLAPIARGDCDHAGSTSAYVVPRSLKHLIKARRATCVAPGCNRPAADGDADHTVPWPQGPTCQHNLGGLCRYHHRCKQAPGWKLEQPEPGVFEWHAPSGRTRTTRPASYLIRKMDLS